MVRVLEHLPLRQERDDKQGNQAEKNPATAQPPALRPLLFATK